MWHKYSSTKNRVLVCVFLLNTNSPLAFFPPFPCKNTDIKLVILVATQGERNDNKPSKNKSPIFASEAGTVYVCHITPVFI